jgi:hypothetical protein
LLTVECSFNEFLKRIANVKLELNTIYTERPFNTPGGLDYGWFCREHALHTYTLLKLLGHPAEVCFGWVTLQDATGRIVVSCTDSDTAHAWCHADGIGPIDLSIAMRHIQPSLVKHEFVVGLQSTNGGTIVYETTPSSYDAQMKQCSSNPRLSYLERKRSMLTLPSLVRDPSLLLIKPPDGGPASHHGPDIFNAISIHCFKLFSGVTSPLFPHRLTLSQRLEIISTQNPRAAEEVMEIADGTT